jgi:hypothetical protein
MGVLGGTNAMKIVRVGELIDNNHTDTEKNSN